MTAPGVLTPHREGSCFLISLSVATWGPFMETDSFSLNHKTGFSHTSALSPGLRSLNIQPVRAVIPQRFLLEICPEGRGVELTDLCVQMPGGSSGDRLFLGRELLPEPLQWESHLPSRGISGSRASPCGSQEHSAKLHGPQGCWEQVPSCEPQGTGRGTWTLRVAKWSRLGRKETCHPSSLSPLCFLPAPEKH